MIKLGTLDVLGKEKESVKFFLKKQKHNFSKITITIALILFVFAAILTCTSTPAQAATLTIMSHSGYLDVIDGYHVYGEFQNRENRNIKCEKVTATFYDNNNNVVAVQDWHIGFLEVIKPNQKSPFTVLLWDSSKDVQLGPKVDYYTLEVTASYTSASPLMIDVVWTDTHYDALDFLSVDGEIKNLDNMIANNTKVYATCYDVNNNVIYTGYTSIDSHLMPGETAPFEITTIPEDIADKVETYSVAALSYVPEENALQPGSGITLFGYDLTFVMAIVAVAAIILVIVILAVVLTLRRRQKSSLSPQTGKN